MAAVDQEGCLLKWINSFETCEHPVESVDQLSDGRALGKIAGLIFPSFNFEAVEDPIGAFEGIIQTCEREFDQRYSKLVSAEYAASGHVAELIKMSTLVLVSSVQCDNKARFIRAITLLDNETQFALKSVIEGMIRRCSSAGLSFDSPQKRRHSSGVISSPSVHIRASPAVTAGTPGADSKLVKDLRERLEQTREELEDALVMHDEVLKEISEKNKVIDSLTFRIRDMESTVERFHTMQDEVDVLRGIEAMYNKMEPQFQQCQEELAAARTKLANMETLQKDFATLSNSSNEDTARLVQLEARVKEYRVTIKTAEMKLSEERSSNSRKDHEIERLARLRDEAISETSRIKAELGAQHMQAIRDTAEVLPSAATVQSSGDREEMLAEISKLREENTKLLYSEDRQKLQNVLDDLEDARVVAKTTEQRLTCEIIERDERVETMNKQMNFLQQELDTEKTAGVDVRRELKMCQVRMARLEAELHTTRHQAANDLHLAEHRRRLAMAEAEAEATRNRKPQVVYGSAPPWGTDSPKEPQNHYHKTDAERLSELERRNKQRQPHLRSQYAVELQTTTMEGKKIINSPVSVPKAPVIHDSQRIMGSQDTKERAFVVSSRIAPSTHMTAVPPKVDSYVAEISPPKAKKKSMPAHLRKRMEQREAMKKENETRAAAERKAKVEAEKTAKLRTRKPRPKSTISASTIKQNNTSQKSVKVDSKPVTNKPASKTKIQRSNTRTVLSKDKRTITRSDTRTVLTTRNPNMQQTTVLSKKESTQKTSPISIRERRKLPTPPPEDIHDPQIQRGRSMPNINIEEDDVKTLQMQMQETKILSKHSPARPYSPVMNSTMKSPFTSASRSKSFTTPSGSFASPLATHVANAIGLVNYASDTGSPIC